MACTTADGVLQLITSDWSEVAKGFGGFETKFDADKFQATCCRATLMKLKSFMPGLH